MTHPQGQTQAVTLTPTSVSADLVTDTLQGTSLENDVDFASLGLTEDGGGANELVGQLLHREDDEDESLESLITAKRESNFYVDFLHGEKKSYLDKSYDAIGDVILGISWWKEESGEPRKRRGKPQQEHAVMIRVVFADDPDNNAADFCDLLAEQEEAFRLRVKSLREPVGEALETFVFKGVTVVDLPFGRNFDVTSSDPRRLIVTLRAESVRRKSLSSDNE